MSDEDAQNRSLPTVDLAGIAQIGRGDRVNVRGVADSTQELFDRTLALVSDELGPEPTTRRGRRSLNTEFVPRNDDLRAIFLLAEAVGSYEAFNDLVNEHSPGNLLSQDFGEKARKGSLSRADLQRLTEYQLQIRESLRNANKYLRDVAVDEFSRDELHQLHEMILTASARTKELNDILGLHYIHEVERVVARLSEFHAQMQSVERSVSGIFMVNSEVMFVPTNEIIECVNIIFEAVGNSYLSRNIDGVLLLAARNLLIDVSSFYSYYGKEQIYTLFKRTNGTVSTQAVTARIRGEIRRLFEACKRDNKLVLTRVMSDVERQFEISVDVIQEEAIRVAVEQVKVFMPREEAPQAEPKQGLLRLLFGWMLK
jgi:hypothetical protein